MCALAFPGGLPLVHSDGDPRPFKRAADLHRSIIGGQAVLIDADQPQTPAKSPGKCYGAGPEFIRDRPPFSGLPAAESFSFTIVISNAPQTFEAVQSRQQRLSPAL